MRNVIDILKQRDTIVDSAKKSFLEEGKLEAMFYLRAKDDLYVLPANNFMGSQQGKNMLAAIIKQLIEQQNIDTLVFCTEAWLSKIDLKSEGGKNKLDEKGNPKVMPRDDPERTEIIMFTTESKEFGIVDVSSIEISRDDEGNPSLGELKKMEGDMSGRFTHFIKPDLAMQN